MQNVVSLQDSVTCLKEYMELIQSFCMPFTLFLLCVKSLKVIAVSDPFSLNSVWCLRLNKSISLDKHIKKSNPLFSFCSWYCFIPHKYAYNLPITGRLCDLADRRSNYEHMELLGGEFKVRSRLI